MFHRLNKVLPDNQQIITVSPDAKVSEALELMRKWKFSQLPVVAGAEVLGVFSYRSFCDKLAKMKSLRTEPGELPVEEFIEQFQFARVTDEFRSVFAHLDGNDAVLVGEPDQLQGIVTAMDILRYLYRVASPFVLVAEIELVLRELILRAVDDEKLVNCAKASLASIYPPERLPTTLEKMNFGDYVQLVCNKENWQFFEVTFGGTRERTRAKLEQVRELRNTIFHFKGKPTWEDHENLSEHRDWILRRARVADAKQRGQGHE